MRDCLVRVPIKEFQSKKRYILTQNFSTEEQQSMLNMNDKSIAARYAAKLAIKKLFTEVEFSLIDLSLSSKLSGAPVIKELPAALKTKLGNNIDKLRISLSHTSLNAVALTAYFGDSIE